MWPLLTGGRCSEVGLCYKDSNLNSKMKGRCRYGLFGGGR
jgi:hypothetical protein